MGLSLKQKVKNGDISPQDAFNQLDQLVDSKYKNYVASLKWLQKVIDGRPLKSIKPKNSNAKR